MTNATVQRKILLVDDDTKLTAFVARHLRGEGYHLDTAMDGQEALDKATTRPPDLVLLDLSMPVMDGI
ncbi:MAG: response regulator, partial [Chloroflexota bacterium]|nr:response regulator [Chloroflexota bacterium]